jgi:glycosyltransferase involved in cell wall biosynthesis
MHVLLITQYFPPEIGAAATRWGDYVKILNKKGHRVTVLCEMPNYPLGEYFPGYKREWVRQERISPNLTIIRTFAWANNRKTTIKKLGHYIVFMLSGFINAIKIKNYDLMIISSPPLFVGAIGAVLAKFRSFNFFLDVRDLWPESVIVLGEVKSRWVFNIGKKLESLIYNSTTGYIFPVPGFKKYFKKEFSSQLKKPMISLINGVSEEFIKLSRRYDRQPDEKFMVLYSGNIGLAQGLDTILQVAKLLQNNPIDFLFVGNGVKLETLIVKTRKMNLNNVSFMLSQKKEDLVQIIKKSSVCLVPLKNKPLFRNAIPSKTFEYMACGRPVIVSVSGEIEKIIKIAKSGLIAQPEDANSIAESIMYYYNNKGRIQTHGENGVMYVNANVHKEILISDALIKIPHMNPSNSSFENMN